MEADNAAEEAIAASLVESEAAALGRRGPFPINVAAVKAPVDTSRNAVFTF